MMTKAPKFSQRQRQLDDEFEQFLKESFSDDSVDSGRLNKYFAKTKQEEQQKKKESQPWWMQDNEADEDEDASKREKAKGKASTENKWLKPKKQSTPLKDNDEKADKAQKSSSQKGQGINSDMTKKKVDMSKDSLEDLTMSGKPEHSMPRDRSGVMPTQASFEDTLSYTETGTSDGLTPASTGPGMDTLEEQADKERFFKDLEAKRGGMVDYRKLIKEADMSNTMGSMRSANMSLTMGSMPSAYMGTADDFSSPLPYRPSPVEEDDSEDDNEQDETPPTASETSPSQPSVQPSKQMTSPKKGMLAKVALLDTGESMFDTSGLQGEATAKRRDRDHLAAGDTRMGATNNLTLGSTGLLTGGTAAEFEALQAALREAANTPTMDFSSTGIGMDGGTQDGTNSRTVDDIIREVNNEKRRMLENTDDIMNKLRRDGEGEGERSQRTNEKQGLENDGKNDFESWKTNEDRELDLKPANENRGFDLQPANGNRGFDLQPANENRGFDLQPANGNRGFDLQPANEDRGFDLQPANENRGFDLQPSNRNRGFDLQPANDNRGIDLQPPNEDRGFDLQPANESRGFDLQPANESRGFDLQPVDESRGFDLQPANESVGFDLQPAHESRGFDLQPSSYDVHPISGDDENSQRKSSQKQPKRARQTRAAGSKATVPRYSHVKGSGYGKPKTAAVWSPVDAAKQRVKGSEVPRLQDRPPVGVGKNIMASVESFAHYIQDHFVDSGKPEPPKSPPIRPQHSTEDPLLSASMRESRLQLVSRERALINEVSEWQAQWKEEHKLNAKLKAEMAALQREAARKGEELTLNHQRDLFKLKQDNFVLQAKLNTADDQQNARKQTVSGRTLEGTTEEEVKLMQKEIIEQETLLHGYQQENERLYSEVRKLQKSNSEVEEKIFRENQKLQTELATVKELLEQRDVALRHKGLITGTKIQQEIAAGNNTAILGAGRITELQVELREAEMQDASHKQRIRQADETAQELKQHIETLVREKNHVQEKLQNVRDVKQREFQDMQQQYQREIETLQKKIRWYAENQDLLDKDTNALREKEEEVKRLKDTLEKVNKQTNQKSTEAQRRARERGADAKRIQDLERQVKEMNDIIRKRHPNSLPALIYAAASASNSDPTQDGHAFAPAKSHTVAFLEGKVKKMEGELDEKEADAKIYARVLEQKYNTMKFQYEDRLQALEKQLKASRQQHQEAVSKAHPHPNMTSLERELENTKELSEKMMKELKAENDELRRKLVKSLKVAWVDQSKEDGGDGETQGDSLQMKLTSLAKELSNKDHEIEMLKSTCERLMQDRFQAFSSGESSKVKEKPSGTKKAKRSKSAAGHLSGGKQYQPENFTGTHVSDVLSENAQLKQQMEQISLEMEQQRVGLQASLAQSEGAIRRAQEEASEDIASLRASHAAEMEGLVGKRALQHSDSQHAKLMSQLDSQQVMIRHLQEQLLEARVDQDSLSAARVREQLLKTQMEQLMEDLNEAKKSHSPEMRHFEALQAKIATMEARHTRREQELQQLITRARHSASYEKDQEISGYQHILAAKNKELQQFRTELDAILEVLRELQRQGVVLPLQSHTVQSLLR